MAEAVEVFVSLGFSIYEGPHIEDEYHNFEALNIPADHPARDMHDTFFVGPAVTCSARTRRRCRSASWRIRSRRSRAIVPGAVFRHDDDVTHAPMFHQIEGFLVDER